MGICTCICICILKKTLLARTYPCQDATGWQDYCISIQGPPMSTRGSVDLDCSNGKIMICVPDIFLN